VVITSIGVAEQKMRPDNAAALGGAGMLSVVLLPMLALRRLRSVSPDQGSGPAMRAPG